MRVLLNIGKKIGIGNYINALGGTITEYSNSNGYYRVHSFTDTGLNEFNVVSGEGYVDYLIVAAGGYGGQADSIGIGGGGAGGLITSVNPVSQTSVPNTTHTPIFVTPGNYTINVGNNGGFNGSGNDSQAFNLTALGGGFGRYNTTGINGGSGGGNGRTVAGGLGLQPTSTDGGYGNDGKGFTTSNSYGGGGGGAGSKGGEDYEGASNQRYGGLGVEIDITGTLLPYAAGGSGRSTSFRASGIGGGNSTSVQNGENGTGSGGGTLGYGGSGIVIIRYRIA